VGDEEPLFLSAQKRRLTYNAFRHQFRKVADAHRAVAPAWPITLHDLRHLYTTRVITRILAECGDDQAARNLLRAHVVHMGWRSEQTLATYTHLFTRADHLGMVASVQRDTFRRAHATSSRAAEAPPPAGGGPTADDLAAFLDIPTDAAEEPEPRGLA
jgi:integrase